MDQTVLRGLTILFCITAPMSLAIHWGIICRRLYQNGSRLPTGLFPWRVFHEMSRYKDLCRSVSDSLSPFYIYVLVHWFNVALGSAVALGYLYRYTNPWQ